MGTMLRLTLPSLAFGWLCVLQGAAGRPVPSVWTVVAIDTKGDTRAPAAPDAAQLSYHYDTTDDVLWFRLGMFARPNVTRLVAEIAVDTGATAAPKMHWWGAHNKDFTFDRIVRATAIRTGRVYRGTVGVGRADADGERPSIDLRSDDTHVRIDGVAILIGISRSQLTDQLT